MSNKISLNELVGKYYTKYWNCTDKRYIAIKGGRGSKKSKTTALRFIYYLMMLGDKAVKNNTDDFPHLVVIRKYLNTHRNSTRAELIWAINQLNASDKWKIPKGELTLTYKSTGQQILFRGLDDPLSLTSIAGSVTKGMLK